VEIPENHPHNPTRLVDFEAQGRRSIGLVKHDTRLLDLSTTAAGRRTLADFLGAPDADRKQWLDQARRMTATHDLSAVKLHPLIQEAAAVWALALNYASHISEGAHLRPAHPMLFLRLPRSFTGHDQPLHKPRQTQQFDYEGELAVMIGLAGSNIRREDAGQHVGGYAVCNEGSVREWQRHCSQITAGKNFWASGSIGPWLTLYSNDFDPYAARLQTYVNGKEVQRAQVGEMYFKIDEVIAYVSVVAPLRAGDVILMGTPGGVGFRRNPQLFLGSGDLVEVEISGLGRLSNRVVDRTD
jgi:2-keto-4-pentenoate hydratase/2-oxohepta-3-ene-1,7-dioic acid hydratase in catechol pathway